MRLLRFSGEYKPQYMDDDNEPYLASDAVRDAVNDAIILGRPLLVRGLPGSGKTRLAKGVYKDLQRTEPSLRYREWHIKSSSRAIDGLYRFDAVARLTEAQLAAVRGNAIPESLTKYIHFEELGAAIKNADSELQREPFRTVLLIDEIDKADIDFPNDLLRELDQMAFQVSETGERYVAALRYRPIVIITSNGEKALPDAFLRRCIDCELELPDQEQLERILAAHLARPLTSGDKERVREFVSLRDRLASSPTAVKVPSTSELLDAFRLLDKLSPAEASDRANSIMTSGVVLKLVDAELRRSLEANRDRG